jgi:DNA-directed RNA polymerase sigma subunit (sigma70/sigma32)
MTLEQVGRELGVSKERVRQLQESGLSKLRDALLGTPRTD